MPGARGHRSQGSFGHLTAAPGVIPHYLHQAGQASDHLQIRGFSPLHFFAPNTASHGSPAPLPEEEFGHIHVSPSVRWPFGKGGRY